MPALDSEVEEIVERVRAWPLEDRRFLAKALLQLTAEVSIVHRPTKPAAGLIGILKGEGVPPNDEECQRILEEEIARKHLR